MRGDEFGGIKDIKERSNNYSYLVMGTNVGYSWPPLNTHFMIDNNTVTIATNLGRSTIPKKEFMATWNAVKNNIFMSGNLLKDKTHYKVV